MAETTHEIREGQRYIVGDVAKVLPRLEDRADLIYLDDAWARPQRANWYGVEYDTHGFAPEDVSEDQISTMEIVDLCKQTLVEGGWLIADADDWLLPRLINYIRDDWGDVASDYSGGGYRRIGGVTFLTQDGQPDRSTPGVYFSNGGYPVIFAHKGETNRRTSVSARQVAQQASFDGDWGSVKPIGPYRAWVEGLLKQQDKDDESGERKPPHLVVPCAGTAPAAIAAEQIFGPAVRYTCIDNEPEAYQMFKQRRSEVLQLEQDELPSDA